MEGISHEAISLAGHLKLNKLIILFDDNQISIDGPTDLSVSDDQRKRFQASGWNTWAVDGHDPIAIAAAITGAQESAKPAMIACRTVIGFGAPTLAGTAKRTAQRSVMKKLRVRARHWIGLMLPL